LGRERSAENELLLASQAERLQTLSRTPPWSNESDNRPTVSLALFDVLNSVDIGVSLQRQQCQIK
jgi:hypothetical protein